MTEYASFRQRLDAALRSRDVQQVRAFLIAEEQWSLEVPTDPEFAMWMMIAGAPTLKDLHAEARQWLVSHGHAEEADAILSRGQGGQIGGKQGSTAGKKSGAGQQKARPKKNQGGAKPAPTPRRNGQPS